MTFEQIDKLVDTARAEVEVNFLRDLFAAAALAGMLSGVASQEEISVKYFELAEAAYGAADAMMERRNAK